MNLLQAVAGAWNCVTASWVPVQKLMTQIAAVAAEQQQSSAYTCSMLTGWQQQLSICAG
jgi:hypothetical protein